MNITVVRPFVNSLYEKKDLSVGEASHLNYCYDGQCRLADGAQQCTVSW